MLLARYELLLRRASFGLSGLDSFTNIHCCAVIKSFSCPKHHLFNINVKPLKATKSLNVRLINTSTARYFPDNSNEKSIKIGKEIIDYNEFEKFRNSKGALIIDVRNPEELLNNGHIPNAINIPLSHIPSYFFGEDSDGFEEHLGVPLPKQAYPIIVFCKAGIRSEMARKLLTTGIGNSAFNNVASYAGSFDEWSENNPKYKLQEK